MPQVPEPLPQGSVPLGDAKSFTEIRLDLPITPGPFEPTWESIEHHYPGVPDWFGEAKFGIRVHFGPQSAGKSGDWYAQRMYFRERRPIKPTVIGTDTRLDTDTESCYEIGTRRVWIPNGW